MCDLPLSDWRRGTVCTCKLQATSLFRYRHGDSTAGQELDNEAFCFTFLFSWRGSYLSGQQDIAVKQLQVQLTDNSIAVPANIK